jgi:hypothetical protein
MNPQTQIARMRDVAMARETWFKEVRDADIKLMNKQAEIINAILEMRPSEGPKSDESGVVQS